MKKNCNNCKAFWNSNEVAYCDLGYKNKANQIKLDSGWIITEGIPLEECPKPKTIKQLIYFKKSWEK